MNPQVAPTSTYHPSRLSHINVEACPSCGQEIPLEKIEEISGKIALREREQALAITTKLEQQYEVEKAQVVAKAHDDLDLERRQSAAREALVREEVQRAAEILINDKLSAAARIRQELQASWQKQLEGAEAARKAAEQTGASLQVQIQQLRQDGTTALETAKAEAKARETEIRAEEKQAAESAVAERRAAIETARMKSETALQARIRHQELLALHFSRLS